MYKHSPCFEKDHSSVSLVSMLQQARLSNIRLPIWTKKVLSSAKCPSWPYGPSHSLFWWVLAALSPQVKRTGCEADLSPPGLWFEVWSYNSALLHGLHKNNFAEFLPLILQYSFGNALNSSEWLYGALDPPASGAAECA